MTTYRQRITIQEHKRWNSGTGEYVIVPERSAIVELSIDVNEIMRRMGQTAMRNKSGRAGVMQGLIVAKVQKGTK